MPLHKLSLNTTIWLKKKKNTEAQTSERVVFHCFKSNSFQTVSLKLYGSTSMQIQQFGAYYNKLVSSPTTKNQIKSKLFIKVFQ